MPRHMSFKTCTRCGLDLPATDEFFYRQAAHGSRRARLRSECRECTARRNKASHADPLKRTAALERHKNYYAAHRVERLAYASAYAQAHPEERRAWGAAKEHRRRARIRGSEGTHTAEDIAAQLNRQKGKCFYCRRRLAGVYHTDHVTPLSLGGSDGPENLVIACPECNWSKHAKHPMDFCGRLL